jgi:hypothetical protein
MRRENINRLAQLTQELLSSPVEKPAKSKKAEVKKVDVDLDVNEDGAVDESDVEMVQKEVRKKKPKQE